MANKISIEFAAKGHPGVIKAVKALNKEVTKLAAVNKLLNNTTEPLTKSQKEIAKGFLEQQRAARNTSSAFSVLRSKMLLASFGASLLAGSLLKLTNMAGDADEQMSKASVVFGLSTDSVVKFAKETSEATGKSKYSLIQMAASVQDILVPMGMMRHEAANLSKDIVKAAIDVASFNNVTEADAMRDFNSALVGNHETVRKYGIVISEARMQQVALSEGIIEAGETLSDQEKIMARLAIIQMDSSDAQGDAIRTAKSYANVMKAVSSEFEETAIAIGKVLMPIVKAFALLLKELLELMQDPKAWISLAFAVRAQAQAFIMAKFAAVGYTAALTTAATTTMKYLKVVGRFVKWLIILEGLSYVYDKIFATKQADDAADSVDNLTEKMQGYSDLINRMTIDELASSIKRMQEELASGKQYVFFPPDSNGYQHMEVLKLTDKQLKETGEVLVMTQQKYDALTGANLDFSSAQQKIIDKTNALNNRLIDYNAISDEEANKLKLNTMLRTTYGDSFDANKERMKPLVKEMKNYIKAESDLAGANEIAKIDGKIKALGAQTKAEKFLAEQKAKGIVINEIDAQSIKDLYAEYEKLKQQKAVEADLDALRQREALLKTQVEKGKELNELEKFNVMLKFSKANLTEKEAEAYKELLKNIDDYNAKIAETQKTTGGGKSSGTSQDDIDILESELDALKNQITPAIEQFRADLLSGMVMFGSGGMGVFGINAFKEVQSAFGNYVTNVIANNEAIELSFTKRQSEIDKMDTSTLDAQKKKLEAEIKLEEDQIDRLEEVEQAKNDVRANAAQMGFDVFNQFMSMRKEAVQNELNEELNTLKTSQQYQQASDKRKEKMEDAVRKKYAKEQLKLFRMDQAAKLASIGMNTAEGIVKAVAAFPTSVPPGAPWTFMIGAMGAAQAGMVLSQKPPKYARGGMIGGNLHAQGGTVIEAERGEYVMSRQAVDSIGQERLNAMNRTGSAGNTINITLSGNVLSDDFVADEFIPKLEERIRVLSDGTITDRFS